MEHKQEKGFIRVTLRNGDKLNTRLVVGADGKNSELARRAGIKKTGWRYNQTALVCAIEHEIEHNGLAWQYFLPNGPLAVLPMKGKRSSVVWTEQNIHAKTVNSYDKTKYTNILEARLGNFLGKFKIIGDRHSYPLELKIADRFVDERLALVGDAAHSIHPIAGQGLNAGFKDIAVLAQVIEDAFLRGEDFGSLGVLSVMKNGVGSTVFNSHTVLTCLTSYFQMKMKPFASCVISESKCWTAFQLLSKKLSKRPQV